MHRSRHSRRRLGSVGGESWLTGKLRPESGNPKFLVIGLGSIELRKGVYLFIECATIIKNNRRENDSTRLQLQRI